MWCSLNVTGKRRYLVDFRKVLIVLLPAGTAAFRVSDLDLEVDKSVLSSRLTPSDVVPLQKITSQPFGRGARKVRIKVLGKAMSSFSRPSARAAQSGFEVSVEAESA